MKRIRILFLVAALCLCLVACGEAARSGQDSQEISAEDSETMPQESSSSASSEDTTVSIEDTTESSEDTTADIEDTTESSDDTTADIEDESQEDASYPGADVVELVNLRGDTTTAYKLADGTYMDRSDCRFTYNGTDTWTDENGVEWNEVVK